MEDLTNLARFVEKSGKGVWVQASTLGALEALLTFLQQMKIPVFNFGIGPIFKNTIVKAAIMLERAPEYAVILAFDVVIDGDARALAEKAGMKIFNGGSSVLIHFLVRGTNFQLPSSITCLTLSTSTCRKSSKQRRKTPCQMPYGPSDSRSSRLSRTEILSFSGVISLKGRCVSVHLWVSSRWIRILASGRSSPWARCELKRAIYSGNREANE